MDTGGSSPGVMCPEYEADHSPPSSAEIKKRGAIPHSPMRLHGVVFKFRIHLMAWYLVKHRTFTFTLHTPTTEDILAILYVT